MPSSNFDDNPFDDLSSYELQRLENQAALANAKESYMRQKLPHLFDGRLDPVPSQKPQLPTILIRQSDGAFLNMSAHDDARVANEQASLLNDPMAVLLILTRTRYGLTYSQPETFWHTLKKRVGDVAADSELKKLGIPKHFASSHSSIHAEALVRSPHDPDRFVDFDDLRRAHPDVLIHSEDIFLQKGRIGRDFAPIHSGQFIDLGSHHNAEHLNSLTARQAMILSEVRAATEVKLSCPNYPWPADMPIQNRRKLAYDSLHGHADISGVFNRLPLRITYGTPFVSRAPSPSLSESSSELPYKPPIGLRHSRMGKRLRGIDDKPDGLPQSRRQQREDRTATGFPRLPAEFIGAIGQRLTTDDVEARISALTPLVLTSTQADEALKDSLPPLRAASNMVGDADELYRRVTPDGAFAESRVPRLYSRSSASPSSGELTDATSDALSVKERFDAIGPTLSLLPNQRRSELVDKILRIADLSERVEAVNAITPHILAFGVTDRSRLFGEVVEALKHVDYAFDPDHLAVWNEARQFLEGAWHHVQDADRCKVAGSDTADGGEGGLPTFNNRYVIDLLRLENDMSLHQTSEQSPTVSMASPLPHDTETAAASPTSPGLRDPEPIDAADPRCERHERQYRDRQERSR